MFRPPDHQIAGHSAARGQLGPLIDDSGRFYKPLQSSGRGDAELSFYLSFSSHPSVPPPVRRFFPSFHGTALLPSSDLSGDRPHLVLDDLLAPLSPPPSVVDLKIGARTWPPDSPDDYLMKCLNKDRLTTSLQLGFRISGLQVRADGDADRQIWRPDQGEVKRYGVADVRRVLRQFVSRDLERVDCERALRVFGGENGALRQLVELKEWFEVQGIWHFYSASVLIAYGKGEGSVKVGLVDFAHVMEGGGVIDHNFLGGLCSLIRFVSEILSEAENGGEMARVSAENGGD